MFNIVNKTPISFDSLMLEAEELSNRFKAFQEKTEQEIDGLNNTVSSIMATIAEKSQEKARAAEMAARFKGH